MADDIVEVAQFDAYDEAEVCCTALQSAGLAATNDGSTTVMVPSRGASLRNLNGYRVFVPEDQLADARAILQSVTPTPAPAADGKKPSRLAMLAPVIVGLLIVVVFLAVAITRRVLG
jgi:hypothetical protein